MQQGGKGFVHALLPIVSQGPICDYLLQFNYLYKACGKHAGVPKSEVLMFAFKDATETKTQGSGQIQIKRAED